MTQDRTTTPGADAMTIDEFVVKLRSLDEVLAPTTWSGKADFDREHAKLQGRIAVREAADKIESLMAERDALVETLQLIDAHLCDDEVMTALRIIRRVGAKSLGIIPATEPCAKTVNYGNSLSHSSPTKGGEA